MVFLPNEILDAILDECDKLHCSWMGYGSRSRYTPYVTINRNWQAAVEERTWNHVKLVPSRGPRNLEAFRSALRAEPRRRRVLKKVEIFFDDYFILPSEKAENAKRERALAYHDEDDYYEDEDGRSISGDNSDSEDATTAIAHHQSDLDHWQDPSALISAFQAQSERFFQDIKAIWDVLAEWPDDLQVTNITFFLNGRSIYKFFGSDFCIKHADYFKDISLQLKKFPILPPLPSVKSLKQEDGWEIEDCELWPAIVTCRVATFLPALEVLNIRSKDDELRWPRMRNHLRQALVNQFPALPNSLKTLKLALECRFIKNHDIDPPNLLINNTDTFSRALHLISHNLTTITIRLSCITADLLWPNDTNAPAPHWPNLRILDIVTAFDRPTGTWWFIPEAVQGWETPERESTEPMPEWAAEDTELYLAAGEHPAKESRTAPDPALFDDLSLRLARAVSRMPVLMYLDLEFHTWRQLSWHSRQQNGGFEGYKAWGFYYRDGERAKRTVEKYVPPINHGYLPGIDGSVVERARTEWVFKCRGSRVGWEEGEESKELWRARGVEDFDVITTDEMRYFWQRRRNGVLIDTSTVSDDSFAVLGFI